VLSTDWRPDPGKGVFETLLVVDGKPVEVETHLQRMERSLNELYDLELPTEAGKQVGAVAAELELGRLRLTATPILAIEAEEISPGIVFPARGVPLLTQPLPGGLGPHKLVDRPKEIDRPAPDEPGALIVDEGEVLEAGWANVFAVRGGTLFTPPLDGRILPGTTRAALLALAAEAEIETQEHPLSPADLISAEETFLTGSIRAVEAALELDGQPLAGCGPISNRLAAALQRRWGLADAPRGSAVAPIPGQLAR
jgi:para-aminobenzoate synthetase/4-amino-4-deoxychorismate lyase